MKKLLTFPGIYFPLAVIFGALPFLISTIEMKLGSLPTAEVWYATGTNHGPWRWELEGFTVFYPLIILLVTTCIAFISRAVKNKKWSLLIVGLLLASIQISLLFLQLYFLGWTVG